MTAAKPARLLDVLAARLGPQHVLTDPADMAGYLVESRHLYEGSALAVVRPADTEEGAFAVRECARAGGADGRVWNGLKGLRKDNSGYDLKNLFVGSEGTLGIITAAVLKLVPRPKAKATAFVGAASARRTLELFARLRQSDDDTLTAFELMPAFALYMV